MSSTSQPAPDTAPGTASAPTLRIIGAGFGRTGTLSTKMALDQLGVRCYHMLEVFKLGSEHAHFWSEALERRRDGEPIDFSIITAAGYTACVDWPASTFYQELLEQYPDAKVLLTLRDPERWYVSVLGSIYQLAGRFLHDRAWYDRAALFCSRVTLPRFSMLLNMTNTVIWKGHFGEVDLRTEHGKQVALAEYERHQAEVRSVVPADRLIEFHPSQGWGPLCEVLGVPVPDTDFPNLNSSAEMAAKQRSLRMYLYASPLLLAGALLGAGFVAHRYVPWSTLGSRISALFSKVTSSS
jgi:Sulfotransferase domain